MRVLRSPSGRNNGNQGEATYSDSTAVYEGALRSKEFYDSLMDYYDRIETDEKGTNTYHNKKTTRLGSIDSINEATVAGLKQSLDNVDQYVKNGVLSQSEADALKKQAEEKIKEIESVGDPNKALISDLVTGLVDPQAPLVTYDKRIDPQSFKTYVPQNPVVDLAMSLAKGASYDPLLLGRAMRSVNSNNDEELKKAADALKMPYSDLKKLTEEAIDKEAMVARNVLGNVTTIPYYDPIMVKPFADLTDKEKEIRIEKALETGQTGGIPESVIQQAKKQPTQQQTNRPATKPPKRPKNMSKMQSIAASEVPNEMPYRVLKGEVKPVTTGRAPQPIMRFDPTRPTNQYQVGELMWDKDKKKWVRDMWDKEDQRASRSLQRDRRSEQRDRANRKYRIIKAPKF